MDFLGHVELLLSEWLSKINSCHQDKTLPLVKTVLPFSEVEVKGCAGANKHEYAGRIVRLWERLGTPTQKLFLLWVALVQKGFEAFPLSH